MPLLYYKDATGAYYLRQSRNLEYFGNKIDN